MAAFWPLLTGAALWETVYRLPSAPAVRQSVLSLAHAAAAALASGAWLWRHRPEKLGLDYTWLALPGDVEAANMTWRYAAYLVVDLAHARARPRPWNALEYLHHYAALLMCALGLYQDDCASAMLLYFGSEISSVFLHLRPLTTHSLRRAVDAAFAASFFIGRTVLCNYCLVLAARRAGQEGGFYLYATFGFAALQSLMNAHWQFRILQIARRKPSRAAPAEPARPTSEPS